MRILLTGATGFIGSNVARILVNQGHELCVLLRPQSDTFRIQDVLPNLTRVTADIFAAGGLGSVLVHQPEMCIHLAWYAEPGKYLNAIENLAALRGSLELASQLSKAGCSRFVGVGTCFEYDTKVGLLAEDSNTMPSSLYGASKLALATVLQALQKSSGMSVAWARLFYQYGPFEDERRLIPAVINSLLNGEPALLTSGKQIRDFLHVTDVAKAICKIAHSTLDGVVNVGSGVPVSVGEIAASIAALIGRTDLLKLGSLPDRAGDPPFVCANNQRLGSTGWSQEIGLTAGLRHTIDWWRAASHSRRGLARVGA
jgi:nucleoside-diphosphate-sugar epimerase